MMFKLGEKVRCKVTGFEGIATSRTEYLNGCVQYHVTPRAKKDGSDYPDGVTLDVENLERISAGITVKATRTGGPPRRGGPLAHR